MEFIKPQDCIVYNNLMNKIERAKMMKVGFGRTDITPELGVRLGGYGVKERPTEEIFDPLHSTAVWLENGNTTALMISLDWCGVEEHVVEAIRSAINKRYGIGKHNITIATTHTHSAPNTISEWGWGKSESVYIDSVMPEIVHSVELTKLNLTECEIGFASLKSFTGVSRRSVNEDHEIFFTSDPDGVYDPEMTVIRFRDSDSNDIGSIVHYGAHCTAMGQNRLVSRDWAGVMKDRIESQFGGPVLFLQGAIGGVGPRTNYRLKNGLSAGGGDGIDAVREVGYRAATDAINALFSIKEFRCDIKLSVLSDDIFIPYSPLMDQKEAKKELMRLEKDKDVWGRPMCEYKHLEAVVEAHQKKIEKGRIYRQSITRLGPTVFVPMPGEAFAGISLRLRNYSLFQYTLCCSVTNGYLSYLPTREARHRGGYETWVGKALNAYLLADNVDDVLCEENLKLLKEIGSEPEK